MLSWKLLSAFAFLLLYSCTKSGGKCELPKRVGNSSITLELKDSSDAFVYTDDNSKYNKDSFRVIDPTGISLPIGFVSSSVPGTSIIFYTVSFGPLYNPNTDQNSFNAEVCKDYQLFYNKSERDSLHVCFKATKTECGSVFQTLKVFKGGTLIADEKNGIYSYIKLVR